MPELPWANFLPRPVELAGPQPETYDEEAVGKREEDEPKSALVSADPIRNFTLSTEERIRALTIGAPAYALRKKHIEDLEEGFVATLVKTHDAFVAKAASAGRPVDAAALHALLVDKSRSLDLKKLNDLVTSHNRYYPIEANLANDPQTGGYLVHGRRWQPEAPFTAERLLASARAVLAARDGGEVD